MICNRKFVDPSPLLIFMRLRVDLIGDEMVEDVSDCMRPVQEKFEEDEAQHVHGKTPSELYVEQREVVVNEGQGRTHSHCELALEDYLYAFEEVTVVEGDGQWLLPCRE